MKYLLAIMILFSLASCTTKAVYLKPAIKGQLIDSQTGLPIKNKGYVAAFLKENDKNSVITDNKGFFYLEATTDNRFIKTNVYQRYQNIPLEIYIYIDGYENKTFDFSKFPKNPKDGGMYKKYEVDVGTIKLRAKK